jgi:hypothetical protein
MGRCWLGVEGLLARRHGSRHRAILPCWLRGDKRLLRLAQPRGVLGQSGVWPIGVEHGALERPETVENRAEVLIILEMDLKPSDLQHEMSVVKRKGDVKLPLPLASHT